VLGTDIRVNSVAHTEFIDSMNGGWFGRHNNPLHPRG
jgi:hypothetical protein